MGRNYQSLLVRRNALKLSPSINPLGYYSVAQRHCLYEQRDDRLLLEIFDEVRVEELELGVLLVQDC